jgi:hypothetical protein
MRSVRNAGNVSTTNWKQSRRKSRAVKNDDRRKQMQMEGKRPHNFARILGKSPLSGVARYSTKDQLGLFVETFGPPEISKRRRTIFWNFTRIDGGRFSLVSRLPSIRKPDASIGRVEVEVRLVAESGIRSFWEWTSERLSGIESSEENPPFLGAANFVMQRLG